MRQQTKLIFSLALALAGVALLFAPLSWLLWRESVLAEEQRASKLAAALGNQAESLIVEAIDLLDGLNAAPAVPCSPAHLRAMHDAAFSRPHIKSVGYWRAAERVCGAGFVQAGALRPPKADRIYDNGVIAWWPSEHTTVAGVPLFVIRFGNHDVAMEPSQLLATGPLDNRQAALWVEGLRMAARPADAGLPSPDSLSVGLTVNQDAGRVTSRYSLGTVFPIDIVVSEPLGLVWERYLPTLLGLAGLGGLLIVVWVTLVLRYSRNRFSLSAEFRDELARGRIRVDYQPIVDLETGRCVGAESLARWTRADGTRVSPEVFVPLAEEQGVIDELTLAVLDRICDDLGDLLRERTDLCVNINLAPENLESPGFADRLAQRLETARLPARSLKLEITERALINSDAVRQVIHELRDRGHQVAIDDFGTGYSSLSYLESFEVDILKIDKAFVDAIETDAVTSNVIAHVIDMAASLGLDTVAEGIEEAHQADWLLNKGVRFGQGFRYSRPLSANRLLRFLKRRPSARVVPLRADHLDLESRSGAG